MADKNVKFKSGSDTLYPETKIGNILNDDGSKFVPNTLTVTSDTSDVTSTDKATSPKYVKDYVGSKLSPINTTLSSKADLQNGKIPSSQLPSYVDDVLEYTNKSSFPSSGETGKIYLDKATNKVYRWGGSQYVEISSSVGLGETAETAYYGNKGKQNANNIATLQTQLGNLQTQVNNLPSPPSLTSDITNTTGTNVATTPKYVADYVAEHASSGGGGSGGIYLHQIECNSSANKIIAQLISSYSKPFLLNDIFKYIPDGTKFIGEKSQTGGGFSSDIEIILAQIDSTEEVLNITEFITTSGGIVLSGLTEPYLVESISDTVTPLGTAGGSSLPDISTATAGQVLMADGSGGMSWQSLPEYNGEVA